MAVIQNIDVDPLEPDDLINRGSVAGRRPAEFNLLIVTPDELLAALERVVRRELTPRGQLPNVRE